MKKLSKILSVLLCLAMLVGVVAVMVGAEENAATATLVTRTSDLAAGDKVVIVATDYDYALSTTQNNNNRKAVAITKNGNEVTLNDNVQILTIEAGTTDGTFSFNTGSGYLYAASSSSNYLRTESSKSVNSSWKITIDGSASVVAQGSNTRNVMQFNLNTGNGDPLFACYGSASQKAIAIYKVNASSSETPSDEETSEETTEASSEVTVTVVENPETGVAYKMGMYQGSKAENLYFTGKMSGYYYATSNEVADGVDVYLEEAEGGYYIYFIDANGQQYLYLEKSGKYNNVKYGETKQVFTFGDYNNLETVLDGTALYLGTYGSNVTIGASAMSYIEGANASKVDAPNGQYVVRLYTVTTEESQEPTTDPSESEETTTPSESEETTTPSESEETTTPSESEETTTPSESEETTAPSESEETTAPSEESTSSGVSGDTGNKTPGDTLSVFVGLLAVSTIGLAIVTSKKKEF